LISALAAPIALLVATLATSVSLERNLAAIFFALGLGLFELGQELLKARLQSLAFMSASIIRACLAFTLCLGAALLGGGGLCQLAMVTVTYFVTTMLFTSTILRSPVAGPKISDLRTFAGFGIPITLSGIVFALHAALDRILAFAWLFQSISQSYIHASFHLAKTPFMMTTQSIAMLIANLLVMPVLLARFGLVGAASSLVIVEAFGAGFGWYLTRKAFPLPFNAFQVMRIVAATAIMALVLTFAKPLLPIGIVSFGVLAATGCAVYVAAAFALDIAGLRKAVIAYAARRNLPAPSIT